MGPQGAGKGTQAEILAEKLKIPAISSGSLLREEIATGSDLGCEVTKFTEAGTLVPDELMVAIIKKRLAQPDAVNGWILDGFPRILSQVELFLNFVQPTNVILLKLNDENSVERLSGRLQCKECHQGFQEKFVPSKTHPFCDVCGGELVRRSDDTPEIIRQRLQIYHKETEPVAKKFEDMGILSRIDGSGTIEEVAELVAGVFVTN